MNIALNYRGYITIKVAQPIFQGQQTLTSCARMNEKGYKENAQNVEKNLIQQFLNYSIEWRQ